MHESALTSFHDFALPFSTAVVQTSEKSLIWKQNRKISRSSFWLSFIVIGWKMHLLECIQEFFLFQCWRWPSVCPRMTFIQKAYKSSNLTLFPSLMLIKLKMWLLVLTMFSCHGELLFYPDYRSEEPIGVLH